MTKYYQYFSDKSGIIGRTRHQRTDLKEIVDPGAAISVNPGLPLFEISETEQSYGLRPRHVELVEVDLDTGGIKGTVKVAIATRERWDAISSNDSFNVGGKNFRLRRKVAEEFGV